MNLILGTSLLAGILTVPSMAAIDPAPKESARVHYKTQQVDGLKIFYREAGSPSRPTIVLLHGYPSSSHMYRELIPLLAGNYHVVAPDMPGYGYSDQPSADQFSYTFDHLATVMDHFIDSIGVTRYSIYIQDYGAPIGFRLFVKHPDRIQTIISQNGNAYEEGLSPFWNEGMVPFWKDRNSATEKKMRELLTLESTKFQYNKGLRNPEDVSPDSYTFDQMTLDRPGNDLLQLDLMYDYQTNVKQYPQWHDALRKAKPPILAVWGKNDPIFLPAGAEAFKKDVPTAEFHLLDTGHFALEEDSAAIAEYMLKFLAKNVH